MILRFGDCRLDLRTRTLHRGETPVHLQPKMFAFLEHVLRARPAVVEKSALLESLWPGVFTAESSLPVLVSALREALGDDAREPRYVRTVHRVGYAFVGEVTIESESSGAAAAGDGAHRLWVGERFWVVPAGESYVGRAPENAFALDHPSISRVHAKLLLLGGALLVEDLGSKNGTWIERRRATGPFAWRADLTVRFGEVDVVHRCEEVPREASTRTASPVHAGGLTGPALDRAAPRPEDEADDTAEGRQEPYG